jgi:hypothetical protein
LNHFGEWYSGGFLELVDTARAKDKEIDLIEGIRHPDIYKAVYLA